MHRMRTKYKTMAQYWFMKATMSRVVHVSPIQSELINLSIRLPVD